MRTPKSTMRIAVILFTTIVFVIAGTAMFAAVSWPSLSRLVQSRLSMEDLGIVVIAPVIWFIVSVLFCGEALEHIISEFNGEGSP